MALSVKRVLKKREMRCSEKGISYEDHIAMQKQEMKRQRERREISTTTNFYRMVREEERRRYYNKGVEKSRDLFSNLAKIFAGNVNTFYVSHVVFLDACYNFF